MNTQPSGAPINRPPYTLATDNPGQKYTIGNIDCLLEGDDTHSECWNVLNMDTWLENWFNSIKQCVGASDVDCNAYLPNQMRQEAWTNTFLREAQGTNLDCTTIPAGACPTKIDNGGDDSLLTKARYKYVQTSIISK